jgi:hypothetical protein
MMNWGQHPDLNYNNIRYLAYRLELVPGGNGVEEYCYSPNWTVGTQTYNDFDYMLYDFRESE